MDVCFSAASLALITTVITSLCGVIGTLFWQLMKAKDSQIEFYKLLSDRAGDLADISVSTLRRDHPVRRKAE